jgi:hypothetical protein
MLKMVQENPFIPIRWMKEHTGMQGSEYFTKEEVETLCLLEDHLTARDNAVAIAAAQSSKGLSKQICNRYLEPFLYHTCICTATEWENFFALRAHPDAEIHIQELAFKMLEAANASAPKKLKAEEWHIPFGENIDRERVKKLLLQKLSHSRTMESLYDEAVIQIATARCARVSYLNFEGKDDYEDDIRLYNRLLQSGHLSPFEHCAMAMNEWQYEGGLCDQKFIGGDAGGSPVYEYGWSGNFRGFIQLRKTIENENKRDERLLKKN